MKPIRITSDFSGYPDNKTERVFVTGQEPDDLDDEYAELLIRKGLAEAKPSDAKPSDAKPPEAKPLSGSGSFLPKAPAADGDSKETGK